MEGTSQSQELGKGRRCHRICGRLLRERGGQTQGETGTPETIWQQDGGGGLGA